MADRYWVGGNNTWSSTAGTKWATTSGGTGGASIPTSADDVFFTNLSTGPCIITATNTGAKSINCTGFTGQITGAGAISVYGNITLVAGMTYTHSGTVTFLDGGTLTTAGKTFSGLTIDATGSTVTLGDALNTGTRGIIVTQGNFNTANYNVTCNSFTSNNGNTRTITMGSGLWTITGILWQIASSNLTFNKDTANILFSDTSTTARSFFGGGLSYNKLTIGGTTGTSILSIFNINTFTELASTKTVAHTISLNTNQTINTWSVTGTVGNIVTVNSSVVGTRRTITLTNATSGIDYLSVQDIGIADVDKFYLGANSTDGGNNLNVYFTNQPVGGQSSNFFLLF